MWSDFVTSVFNVFLRLGLHELEPSPQLGQHVHYTPVITPPGLDWKIPFSDRFQDPESSEVYSHLHATPVHQGSSGLPLDALIPFGVANGDTLMAKGDDAFAPVTLATGDPFIFGNTTYSSLFVNTNGGLSFEEGVTQFIPNCHKSSVPMITPFWADANTQNGGNITYRQAMDSATLKKVDVFLQRGFPGQTGLKWAFVLTMLDMPFVYAKPQTDSCPGLALRNTFQTVLARGTTESYVIFLYNKIQWTAGPTYTYGDGGDGCTGTGGKHPPVAGFDAADGKTRFQLPTSCSHGALDIASTTNIGLPGVWIFRVTSGPITPSDIQCLRDGDLLSDPYDCSSFYQCSNLTPIKKTCPLYNPPQRLVFDPFQKVCTFPQDYPCKPIPTKN